MFNFIIYLCIFLVTPIAKTASRIKSDDFFAKPITFTQPGLFNFIKQVYNHDEYADFLAHNLFHVTQFLKNMSTQPCPVLRMFGNKLKQTAYVNPYAYADFLDEIISLLKNPTLHNRPEHLKKQISKKMYDQMLHKFDYLKQDPHAYFNELTDDLITIVHKNPAVDAQKLELNKTLVWFFELTLSKLVWHPSEYKEAWKNLLRISEQLTQINENILHNSDDLNALIISLLERFYLFLDLSYAEIPVDFYCDLRKQTTEQPPLLFTITEYTCNGLPIASDIFQTKLQRFEKMLTLAEAKTRAYNEGIYAQHYIPPWRHIQ